MFGRANCLVAMVGLWACASVAAGAGVVAWYEFEDNLLDSSGNGRDGTIALDPPDYVAGVDGQAIRFDTTNEGVKVGTVPITSAFTVGLWINTSSLHSSWFVDQTNATSPWKGWILRTTSQGGWYVPTLQLGNNTAARLSVFDVYSTLGPDNSWHHLVGTHDGASTATLYLDGRQIARNTAAPYTNASTSDVYIRRPAGYSADGTVQTMDDVVLLNRAIGAAEVAAMYNDGFNMRMGVTTGDQAVIALQGFATPSPTLQPYTIYNYDVNASHTIDIAEVDSGGNATDYTWLSLSASQFILASGGNDTLTATIDHVSAALAPGVYTAYVKFSDDAATPNTVIREIQVTVLGCQWAVTPGAIERYYLVDSGDAIAPAVFKVANTGKHGLTYTVQEVVNRPWLALDKAGSGASLDYQATDTVTATIDATGLAKGTYTCDIRFTNNCNPAEELVYTVTLNVEYDVSAPGLLAYYRFEDSAKDWTGNGWNGTATGAPSYREGNEGRAIEFHGVGSGDGVDLGDIPCPQSIDSPDMSVAMWFRADTLAIKASWLINKIQVASGGYWTGWQIKNSSEWFDLPWEIHTVEFRWCHDGLRDSLNTSNPNTNIAIPTLYDGNWHQIVFTIEDADGEFGNLVNVRGYFDGALIEGQNVWNQTPEIIRFEALSLPFEPAPTDTNVWLSGDVDRVLGGVDELSLWNRALTPDDILALYEGSFNLHPQRCPDIDDDGDVDLSDFGTFQACFNGPNRPYGGGPLVYDKCECLDLDKDLDLDLADFAVFQSCFNGPNRPPAPGCP